MKQFSTEKKILWFLSFFLVFIAIAALGFLVIYFIKDYVVNKPPAAQTTANKTASSSAGLKEYAITDNAIITYPGTFEVTESTYGLGTNTVSFTSPDFTFQVLKVRKELAKMAGQDFDKFYTMKDGQSQRIESPLDEKKETFTKVRNRTYSGLQAIEYKSSPEPAPTGYTPDIGVIIDAEGTLILITASESKRAEFEKILKTFTYKK